MSWPFMSLSGKWWSGWRDLYWSANKMGVCFQTDPSFEDELSKTSIICLYVQLCMVCVAICKINSKWLKTDYLIRSDQCAMPHFDVYYVVSKTISDICPIFSFITAIWGQGILHFKGRKFAAKLCVEFSYCLPSSFFIFKVENFTL